MWEKTGGAHLPPHMWKQEDNLREWALPFIHFEFWVWWQAVSFADSSECAQVLLFTEHYAKFCVKFYYLICRIVICTTIVFMRILQLGDNKWLTKNEMLVSSSIKPYVRPDSCQFHYNSFIQYFNDLKH